MLEFPAVFHADGLAGKVQFDVKGQLLFHIHFIKIRVIEFPAQGLDLQFLDQGKLLDFLAAVINQQLDKGVVFLLLVQPEQVAAFHGQRDVPRGFAVKNGRHKSLLTQPSGRALLVFCTDLGR